MKLESVKSADGTSIAFETTGQGPPLILVGGAFCDRTAPTSGTPLAALLAHRFTVLSYDRRGRGDSEDTPPYALEREVRGSRGAHHRRRRIARSCSATRRAASWPSTPPLKDSPSRSSSSTSPPSSSMRAGRRPFEALATQLDEAAAGDGARRPSSCYLPR